MRENKIFTPLFNNLNGGDTSAAKRSWLWDRLVKPHILRRGGYLPARGDPQANRERKMQWMHENHVPRVIAPVAPTVEIMCD